MKSRAARSILCVCGLGAAGAVLQTLAAPVWSDMRAREPALRLESAAAAAGQGTLLALLGGFRALVADALWIQLYVRWEQHDLAATDALVRLVPAVDPRPVYFWLNGARILAHDLSAWRVWQAGGYERVPVDRQHAIDAEQGRRALQHLEQAAAFHPQNPDLWIERGIIELNRLRDPLAAAASFRRAWEARGPYYAARLHAEMLRRGGRPREALEWLKKLHPTLPAEDEAAAADVVLGRMRELERELGIAADRAYVPPPAR